MEFIPSSKPSPPKAETKLSEKASPVKTSPAKVSPGKVSPAKVSPKKTETPQTKKTSPVKQDSEVRDLGRVERKPVLGFPTRSYTNRAVQPQKMVNGMKFLI